MTWGDNSKARMVLGGLHQVTSKVCLKISLLFLLAYMLGSMVRGVTPVVVVLPVRVDMIAIATHYTHLPPSEKEAFWGRLQAPFRPGA